MNKKEFSDKTWSLITGKKDLTPMCFICGEDHPAILIRLEAHHVFSKAVSGEMVNVCLNCHTKITDKQNIIKTKVISEKDKLAFMLVSSGKILELIAQKWQEAGFEIMKDGQNIS